MAPDNLPLYFSKSVLVRTSKKTTSPTNGLSKPGDHAFGNPIRAMVCGSTTCAENRLSDQPRPKGQASRCALVKPHEASVSRVHSLARLRLGDPVSRGPMASVKWLSVSI